MRIKYNIDWVIKVLTLGMSKNRVVKDIFNYQEVIKERVDLDREIFGSNNFYGMSHILKRYSGYKKRIRGLIEHAPGLTNIALGEYKSDIFNNLYVCSKQRKEFLKDKTDKVIIDIGPSIAYANTIYSIEQINNIKDKLGKVLLIYPIHNIHDTDWKNDTERFISYVNEIKNKYAYDTVLVSMYYVDIERGLNDRYEQEGYVTISAGNISNYDFNDCMKTILSFADNAIFQGYSSAIGYCIYMGIPVHIYPGCDEIHNQWKNNYETDVLDDFARIFGKYDSKIDAEKMKFCNYWFGYDSVRKPNELRSLLEVSDTIYRIQDKAIIDEIIAGNKLLK